MNIIFHKYSFIFISVVIILIAFGGYLFFSKFTGGVVISKVSSENFDGNLVLNFGENKILANKTIFIAIIGKNNSVLASTTKTFDELMNTIPSTKVTDDYYLTFGDYAFPLNKLIPYEFGKGEYEIDFTMFNPDLLIRQKISTD